MAFLTTRFFSDTTHMCQRCEVLLPDRPDPKRPIPTLYLLHGLSDDETIWMRRTAIERYANAYYLAVVMPFGERAFYTDNPSGTAGYASYITEELPRLMESYFHLDTRREGRFIAGLSMGGYGTFKSAFAHPERYGAAAAMSAVCDINWLRTREPALFLRDFGVDSVSGVAPHDLFAAAPLFAKIPAAQRPKLFQYCGVDDFLFAENVRLRDYLRSEGVEVTWVEGPGGHCWENWDAQIQNILKWLPLEENKAKTGAIGI